MKYNSLPWKAWTLGTAVAFSLAAVPMARAGAWYDQDWFYRKEITFTSDSAKIPSTQSYFPALVKITADADIGGVCQANCGDLLFTTSDGTRLDHEIEKYEVSGGKLTAWVWVEVPTLSTGTQMYLYYGNSSCSDQQRVEQTWNGGSDASPASNFKMVQHLQEDPTGTLSDSTSYGNDGTSYGGMTSSNQVGGQIAGSLVFDGTDDYVDCGNDSSLDITGPITIEAWVKCATSNSAGGIVGKDAYPDGYCLDVRYGSALWLFGYGGYDNTSISSLGTSWHHLAFTIDGTTLRYYVDGSQVGTDTASSTTASTTRSLLIGCDYYWSAPVDRQFDGGIDEVRISNIARSADWITASYYNTSDPDGFLTLGAQQQYFVPEPGTAMLLGLAWMLLLARFRRNRKNRV